MQRLMGLFKRHDARILMVGLDAAGMRREEEERREKGEGRREKGEGRREKGEGRRERREERGERREGGRGEKGEGILIIPAGKTTVLYKLKLGEIVTTIPTIGMNLTR